MLPGACLEWFTVQHFVEVDAGDGAVCWSTPDAPLVCLQDVNRGRWPTELPIENGRLYGYVMNNYWFTNYLAGQEGAHRFRFSITSRPKSDPVASARAGWGVSCPLVAVRTDANPLGTLPPGSASLVQVEPDHVLLIGSKQAESSDGLVFRLWNVLPEPTTARIHLPMMRATAASACSLVEVAERPLSIEQSVVEVPVPPSGLGTVLAK